METMIRQSANTGRSSRIAEQTDFFQQLRPAAYQDLTSMEHAHSFPANLVLFSEREDARGIFIVLEGEVRLSVNSSDGKRLSLRIARKGDILGLASALSGNPYEMSAETLYPAKIAWIDRRDFLAFLGRHPEAYQAVTRELSRQMSLACDQLRNVGLSASAPEKLARLLLDWSENGSSSEAEGRVRFSLTHEEIGEFIGASRETVTRTLTQFKDRHLVSLRGSMLMIHSRSALANYAGA